MKKIISIIKIIKEYVKQHWRSILFVLAILLIVLICLYFEELSQHITKDNEKGELFKVILTFIAGIIAILVWHSGYKRVKVMEKQTEKTAEQIQVMYKGNVDTRFNNAVGHLGNDNLAVVLGGIHALHQIAVEHENYTQVVHNLFCSYLRENAEMLYEKEKTPDKCPIIIQLLIDYLFKPYNNKDSVYKDYYADLSYIELSNCNFNEGTLNNCKFEYRTLNNCKFFGGTLNNCSFKFGALTNCDFTYGTLNYCNFNNETLTNCDFSGGTLTACDFLGETLTNCDFSYGTLRVCCFANGTLTNCDFSGGTLTGCDFSDKTLTECDFSGGTLTECDFTYGTLTECDFSDGTLKNCEFVNKTYDEYSAKLYDCRFDNVKLDNTELPPNETTGGG